MINIALQDLDEVAPIRTSIHLILSTQLQTIREEMKIFSYSRSLAQTWRQQPHL